MPSWKTPGVYVEEISKLPPSVASAVLAFVGQMFVHSPTPDFYEKTACSPDN